MKGIYCLISFLNKSQNIKIGKRLISFKRGYYCYIGSAQNKLEKRIERHLRKEKKKHWHIDYFLDRAEVRDVICIKGKKECKLSANVEKLGIKTIDRFGCSDCECSSHLFKFAFNPTKSQEFIEIFKEDYF